MKVINGGVCAPKGFMANGIHAGIRKNKDKIDMSLIVSKTKANAAAVYTTNLVMGAPIYVTKANLNNGYAQAMLCNSGNANTCNANGIEIATESCEILAKELKINPSDVIVASTGVIGQPLSILPFKNGMKELVEGLASDEEHANLACQGIMTTDTVKKEIAVEFEIDGKVCHIGAITKGSGMIHPALATMLCFITTDVAITSTLLNEALLDCVDDSFNMLSVDGDTSTNDMVSIMANGLAGNEKIVEKNLEYGAFVDALKYVCVTLAKKMAKDGEGATKLLIVDVNHAKTKEDAKIVAKSVVCSSLLKAAMFGSDANWGRVLCAIGYSKANVDIFKVDVAFESEKGNILVCKNGSGVEFSEEIAKEILLEDEITIQINLNDGEGEAQAFGCDLTYDYVKINGDYRS
ncbi:MAG: bifunctional ornithine acetyltransferase/N-acetylglutamate synthase [Acholeplasmatales bacterium]|nr:bifunctional ornithine acetyltransferase/N-acetylglutamate synthase [Acholeplasmatales bacterium]